MLSDKFIAKYMRLARQVGMDNNPCPSRQIGVVIVDTYRNRILGTGYNGPPAGTPHCDSQVFLEDYFWPQLTNEEKDSLRLLFQRSKTPEGLELTRLDFAAKYAGCGSCPRRLIKAKSGERSELCSCQHAERNAITNACVDLTDAEMFCWCGVPCIQCAGSIINARIGCVHCLRIQPDYHPQSRFLFEHADISLIEYDDRQLLDLSCTSLVPVPHH